MFTRKLLLGAALACLPLALGAETYDTIVQNARIIDGTGNPWYKGDVAIKDGRIAALGNLDPASSAPRVIDAHGSYLTPGFIDVHTHCEDDLFKMPEAENFVRMGVTSIVMGNCGSSYLNLGEAFTSHTQVGMGLNVGSLVGHNPIRQKVMGNEARDPSTSEIAAMRQLVRKAMNDGALGLSTGLIYTPGIFSKTPEIVALAQEAALGHGIYATHMRSEGINVFASIEETLSIGRQCHMPVEISHFKVTAPKHFGASTRTLQMVEDARREGIDVTVDQYAYAASSTSISTMLPEWAVAGTRQEVQARLKDPATREKIIEGIIKERRDDSGRKDLSYARIASFRANPALNGKNLLEIAAMTKGGDTSWHAQADTVCDIMTSGGAGMVFYSMDEQDVERIAQYPNTMFGSDSGIRQFGQGMPHPRGYGNNARVLASFVREKKLLRLEEAVRKMTSLPAQRFGFLNRGVLRPGAAADLVVFDLDKVKDASTFEQPHAYAEGFDYVLVNGEPVIDAGKLTHKRPGTILYGPAKDKLPAQ